MRFLGPFVIFVGLVFEKRRRRSRRVRRPTAANPVDAFPNLGTEVVRLSAVVSVELSIWAQPGPRRSSRRIRPVIVRLRPYLPTAALAFLIFYFGFHALTGERGLLSSPMRDAELTAKRHELALLQAERADLEVRAKLLRDSSLSRDLLEERARSLLGYSDPRDYVIRIEH